MKPFIKSLCYISILASLCSCSDEMLSDSNGDRGDGSISFSVYDEDHPFVRASRSAANEMPVFVYENSKLVTHGKDSLWFHVSSCENREMSQSATSRAEVINDNNLSDFIVCANVGDKHFFTEKVQKTDNVWRTDNVYYWPQNESVSFYAAKGLLGESETDEALAEFLKAQSDGTIQFDYTVPTSDSHDRDAEVQRDFVVATHTYSRTDEAVRNNADRAHIQFRHPLAAIVFRVSNKMGKEVESETSKIAKISISGLHGSGHCTFNGSKPNNFTRANWKYTDEADKEYTQIVSATDRPLVAGTEAVAESFMVLPHQGVPDSFAVTVEMTTGEKWTSSLAGLDMLEPGRLYIITLSKEDIEYPPVNNLQGMVGNDMVTLNWTEPVFTTGKPAYINQRGVKIVVTPRNTKESDPAKEYGDPQTFYRLISDSNPNLDLFSYLSEDSEGNFINTLKYDEFKCDVYALYFNDMEDKMYEEDGVTRKLWPSTARSIVIRKGASNAKVAFYIPEGGLLDDDDFAAYDWFFETFPDGIEVSAEDLEMKRNLLGFNTVWFPCGVSLDNNHEDNAWNYPSEVENVNYYLREGNNEINEGDFFWFKDNVKPKFEAIKWKNGMYDDPISGEIVRVEHPENIVSARDNEILYRFYRSGGNLLLTTFALTKVYDFGIIPDNCDYNNRAEYMPHYRLFNEFKQSSIWFVRATSPRVHDEFRRDWHTGSEGGRDFSSHPIYKGMFRCDPALFPECELDNNSGLDFFYYVCGDREEEMYPLLSMDSKVCENNNVVWHFRDGHQCEKRLVYFEADTNCRAIGSWGQKSEGERNGDDWECAGIVEFLPDNNMNQDANPGRHGRCIGIGLGAYEFNNGTRYVRGANVLNRYQSNTQLLTKNALEYLVNKDEGNNTLPCWPKRTGHR